MISLRIWPIFLRWKWIHLVRSGCPCPRIALLYRSGLKHQLFIHSCYFKAGIVVDSVKKALYFKILSRTWTEDMMLFYSRMHNRLDLWSTSWQDLLNYIIPYITAVQLFYYLQFIVYDYQCYHTIDYMEVTAMIYHQIRLLITSIGNRTQDPWVASSGAIIGHVCRTCQSGVVLIKKWCLCNRKGFVTVSFWPDCFC